MAYVAPDFPLNDSKPIRPRPCLVPPTWPQACGIAPALVAFLELACRPWCQSPIVTTRRRRGAVATAAVAIVGCWWPVASAEARADLQGIEVADVHEAEHSISIRIDGWIAAVEARQVIVNQGDRDTEIFYAFDLPREAAVTGVEIRLPDGRRAVSSSVDARAAFHFVSDEDSPGRPDLGLLRVVDRTAGSDDRLTRYELRVFPVLAGKSAVAIVRWQVPVRYRDGRLQLRIPGRGTANNRVHERFDVTWRAPAAARGLRDVRAGGTISTASSAAPVRTARLRLVAPADADIVLEARPVFRSVQPVIADLATTPLDKGGGAYALALMSPSSVDSHPSAYERIILLVDTSRSLGRSGIAATRVLTDALLDSATPTAQIDAIRFDRRAHAIVGRLTANRSEVKKGLTSALSSAGNDNGTDLGAALDEVASLLQQAGPTAASPVGRVPRGATDSTLVVIITDSVLPLGLDGAQALSRVGSIALNEARIASIVLVPDQAPLPDPYEGPLGELARRTGGRIVTVRHGEASTRAAGLWSAIAQPAPLRELEVQWQGVSVTGESEMPAQLEPGEGAVLFGWYRGMRPNVLTVRGDLRGREVSVRTRKASALTARTVLALALMNRPPEELLSPTAAARGDSAESAQRALLSAASRVGLATQVSSLVILDTSDAFARDRLALARKWGPSQYRRFPPPAEKAVGEREALDVRPAIGRSAPPAFRRTGELDRGIIERLMKHYVVPRARACYDRALRRDPDLTGAVTIELEMVRGEVQDARISRTTISDAILTECLLDAAFATPVPQVALGDTSEVVVVARYPLRLRRIQKRPEVSPGVDSRPSDPNDPLGGIDP